MKTASNSPTDDLTDRTQAVWQPRVGRELTCDEAEQITANVTRFFSLLAEWAHSEAQEAQCGAVSQNEEARDEG